MPFKRYSQNEEEMEIYHRGLMQRCIFSLQSVCLQDQFQLERTPYVVLRKYKFSEGKNYQTCSRLTKPTVFFLNLNIIRPYQRTNKGLKLLFFWVGQIEQLRTYLGKSNSTTLIHSGGRCSSVSVVHWKSIEPNITLSTHR